MPRPVFKARVDALGRGTIAVDDYDISNLVSGFTIRTNMGDASEVVLTLIAPELDLDIEAEEIGGAPDVR